MKGFKLAIKRLIEKPRKSAAILLYQRMVRLKKYLQRILDNLLLHKLSAEYFFIRFNFQKINSRGETTYIDSIFRVVE